MPKFESIQQDHKAFIEAQKMFFVATAGAAGTVNVSPKGTDSLRVLDENTVTWLNITGSGNETSAHVQENGRMTVMFCAFEGKPMILRLYGAADVVHPRDDAWQEIASLLPEALGIRQFFRLRVELVQTSCGFGVPLYDYVEDRELMKDWAEKRGPDGIAAYWRDRNQTSLDGRATNIVAD